MSSSVLIALIAAFVVLALLGFILVKGPGNDKTKLKFGPAKLEHGPGDPAPLPKDKVTIKAGRDANLKHHGALGELDASVEAKRDVKADIEKGNLGA